MFRRILGRVGTGVALAALAVPVSLIAASPAQAVNSCTSSMSPKVPLSQSAFSVACTTDVSVTPSLNMNRIEIGDITNAAWHRAGARTATVAAAAVGVSTLVFTPALTAADVGREISGTGIAPGTFIKTAAGAISRKTAAAVPAATVVTIVHSRSRQLNDASCVTANTTLTSPGGVFSATDVGLSVTGGPYGPQARIVAFLTPTTVTVDANGTVALNQAPATACLDANTSIAGVQDVINIGSTKYSPATALTTSYPDTYTRQIALGAAPSGTLGTHGGACSGSTITLNSGGGGTFAADVGLPVFFKKSTGFATDAIARKVNSVTATTIVMSAACPSALPVGNATDAVIGVRAGGAPANDATMATLNSTLNLNPAQEPSQDECAKNTYEGFSLSGEWENPGSYVRPLVIGGPLPVSTGQILFRTSVVSFAGYVTYRTTGMQVGLHNAFVFPLLPTGLALCAPTPPVTTNKTLVSLKFGASTGGGENTVRTLGPVAGVFTPKVNLMFGTTVLAPGTLSGTPCTLAAATAVADYSCGDA